MGLGVHVVAVGVDQTVLITPLYLAITFHQN